MKLPNKIKAGLLTLFLVLPVSGLFAQQTFKYRAMLQKVDSSGFYQIPLNPLLIAKCKADLADVRILDQDGKFVPYIFGSQLPVKNQASFVAFPQVNNPAQTDTASVFMVENKGLLTIDQLYLKLRNTSVSRTLNLSGSDDLNNWYAIKENMELATAGSSDKGVYDQLLNFPSSTYRYFKIQITHKNKEPVAVLQVGVYHQQYLPPVYIDIQNPELTKKDSGKVSHITISFNDHYQLNKLHLDITGSKYFKRNVRVFQFDGADRILVSDTVISSTGKPDLIFSAKTNKLELEISNEDNPPLQITSIETSQLNQPLISYLEKGQQYQLLFGDAKATAPDYDLKFFADSLNKQIPQINHEVVTANVLYHISGEIAKKESMPTWMIWIAIAAVIIMLVMLTFKMTQEVNKRVSEKKDTD